MANDTSARENLKLQKLLQSGFTALRSGDRKAAARICKEALAEHPGLARAHYLAALIALASDNRNTAIYALETTVKLNNKHAAAWAQLAELYAMSGALRRAEASLNNAVATHRGKASTLDQIGTVFRLAGNIKASLEWHEKAVAADGARSAFRINLANAHLYLGDLDSAHEVLTSCIQSDPDNAQAHWLLSRARTSASLEHVETMQSMLKAKLPDQSVAYLQYAIGKELEDLQDWDGAFSAWDAGAKAKRELVAYDETSESLLIEFLEATFTQDWLEKNKGDCFDAGPIFIVGQPRTGTTLLDRMLDAHPFVTSAGELRHFGIAVRQITGSEEPRQFSRELIRLASTADMSAIGEAYVDMTSGLRLDSAHIIDKLPTNFLYLPLIFAALPNARVIHVRRDPMDTCLAVFKQLFADAYLYSYDLAELGRHYQRYRNLMNTWRERFGDRFIEVDYEALVSDPEESLRPVLQYIGLSWNGACLEYFNRESAVTTASAYQVRESPHQRSVGRWRNFEKQLQPLRTTFGDKST